MERCLLIGRIRGGRGLGVLNADFLMVIIKLNQFLILS